jgi:osmotically-inducible protein OsmY
MKGRERIPIVVLAAAFALASAACRPSQTVERQTDDAAIEAKIKAKLATEVGASTITAVEVNVTNGVVTLAGPVSTQEERQKIEAVARGSEGVVSVTNNIQVSGADVPAPQPATTSVPPGITPR